MTVLPTLKSWDWPPNHEILKTYTVWVLVCLWIFPSPPLFWKWCWLLLSFLSHPKPPLGSWKEEGERLLPASCSSIHWVLCSKRPIRRRLPLGRAEIPKGAATSFVMWRLAPYPTKNLIICEEIMRVGNTHEYKIVRSKPASILTWGIDACFHE